MRLSVPLLTAVVVGALALGGCATAGSAASVPDSPSPSPTGPLVRLGVGPEPESRLLGHVMAELLRIGGFRGEVVDFGDGADSRQALELGAVEARPGYTGETWLESMGRADPPGEPAESFTEVRDFDAANGVTWLYPRFDDAPDVTTPPANATFALMVQGPPGVNADLRTVSQLAARIGEQPDATLCVDTEFIDRRDGLAVVLEAYRIREDVELLGALPQEAVLGVAAGDCIAGLTTATDGAAWGNGLRPLVDDLRVFPAFVVAPQVRQDTLTANSVVANALAPLPRQLTTQLLGEWNARVAVGGESVEQVAADAARILLDRAGRPAPPVPSASPTP